MFFIQFIFIASILLHLLAIFYACRIAYITKNYLPWVLAVSTLGLITSSHLIFLFKLQDGFPAEGILLAAHKIEIFASSLYSLGIIWAASVFLKISESRNRIRAKEKKLRSLFHSPQLGRIVFRGHTPLFINETLAATFGFESAEALLKNRTLKELFPPANPEGEAIFFANWDKSPDGSTRGECVGLKNNGEALNLLCFVNDIQWDGKPAHEATMVDITEHRLVTEALKKSEESLEKTQKLGSLGTWEWDIEGNQLVWSKETYRIFGVNPQTFQPTVKNLIELIHPEDRQMIISSSGHVANKDGPDSLEHRIIRPDGEERIVVEQVHVVTRSPEGKPTFILGFIQDVTEQKENQKRLDLMAATVEQVQEGIVITNKDGGIEYVNSAFAKITGYKRAEATGKNISILRSGKHDESFYDKLWTQILGGKEWRGELINRKKDGSFYSEVKSISPVFNQSREVVNFVGVMRDVTEAIKLETQLRQSQKMEAIGMLAGGIAHDFNNLLTPMFGYLDLLSQSVPKEQQILEDLDVLKQSAQKAKELVAQILQISRPTQSEPKVMDVGKLAQDALRLMRAALPKTVSIKTLFMVKEAHVNGDISQVHTLIMNLLTNANQAMAEGGVVTVSLDEIELQDKKIDQRNIISGKYIRLTVQDTGVGMDEETKNRIFDPFFTTKEVGKGTGLGLSTVFKIVEQHKGYIMVWSQPEEGSTFEVLLPAWEGRILVEKPLPKGIKLKGSERILLVDDEEQIVEMCRRGLETLGYTIVTATRPHQALQAFSDNPNKFDLVISDLTMPESSGLQLIKQIHQMRPAIPAIICTGNDEKLDPSQLVVQGINALIHKPYSHEELAWEIRQVLDHSTAQKPLLSIEDKHMAS